MATSSTQMLINKIKQMDESIKTLQENLNSDDASAQAQINLFAPLKLRGTIKAYRLDIDPGAFVVNHPVQGELNNTNFQFEIGYVQDGNPFPLTFPNTFVGGNRKTLIFEKDL